MEKINTNTTGRATSASTTSKAAKMDAATIATTAAAILKKYGTISAIRDAAASLREKYGAQDWRAILRQCQDFRKKDIEDTADAARVSVFSYSNILTAAFKVLAGDANWRKLCQYARASYKTADAETAAALVRDYYTAVDASGAPLALVRYISASRSFIYTAYQCRPLADVDGVKVLRVCLDNMKRAALKTARKGTDTGRAALDNVRAAGVIVDVYATDTTADTGAYFAAVALTGAHATTDKTHAASVKSAAAAVGHAIPETAAPLAEINAEILKAYRAAAGKALAEKRAAVTADAAAAGVKTAPAPRKTRARKTAPVSAETLSAAAASLAAADAFTANNNAVAAAGKIVLNS